jgi:hypothetical protein
MSSLKREKTKYLKGAVVGTAVTALLVGASTFHKLFANPQNPISDEVFGEYLSFLAKYGKT